RAEGRPVPAAAVRRAVRPYGLRQDRQAVRARNHRDRAARLHARAHAQPLVHHPGRGAEHDARADEDVPDAHRLRHEGRHHRRRDADRPGPRPEERTRRGRPNPRGRSRDSVHEVHERRRRPAPARAEDHRRLRARNRARQRRRSRMSAKGSATSRKGKPRLSLDVQYGIAPSKLPAPATLRRWAKVATERDAAVTLRFVGKREGQTLNALYRGKEYATNVLAFAYDENPRVDPTK